MKAEAVNDPVVWDNFLLGINGTSVLQSYDWGTLKSAFGWQPFRLGVFDDGKLIAGMSLFKRGLPGYGGSSLLYAPHGPVLSQWTAESLECLLAAVRELADREKAIFLRIDPQIQENESEKISLLREQKFLSVNDNFQPRYTLIVDLSLTEEELLKSFAEKHRYNIRLARRKGVEVNMVEGAEGVKRFFSLLEQTRERQNFQIRSLAYYEKVSGIFTPQNKAKIFVASHGGEDLAAVFILKFGERIWYMYGASSNVKRNFMPNYLLHWELMCWAKSVGCTSYDMWGIPVNPSEGQPLWGVYRFKKGFSGKMVSWAGCFDLPFKWLSYKIFTSSWKIYRGYRNYKTRGKWQSVLGEGT